MDNAYAYAVIIRHRQQELARAATTHGARYVPPVPRPRRRLRVHLPERVLRRAFRPA